MKWFLKHNVLLFFVAVYLFSWMSWSIAYLLFPDNFLLQLPLMRLGAFSPALMSMFFYALKDSGEASYNRKWWSTFLIVWFISAVHFYLYLRFVREVDPGVTAMLVTAGTSLLPAFVVAGVFSRKVAVREHLASLLFPKGRAVWYIIAFLVVPALLTIDVVVNYLLGNDLATPDYRYADYGLNLIGYFLLIVVAQSLQAGGLSEEPGWRGYAQKELQKRYSPLVVGLMVGMAWGIWHFPVYLAQIGHMSVWMIVFGLIQLGLIFTWIYNHTGGSLLAVIVLHASWNTFTQFIPRTTVFDMVMGLLLIGIVVTDRMWQRKSIDLSNM